MMMRKTSLTVAALTSLLCSTAEARPYDQIVWDASHGVLLSYDIGGNHASAAAIMDDAGYVVDENVGPVLGLPFDDIGIFIASAGSAYDAPYTGAEGAALLDFVANGGGLLVLADNNGMPNDHLEAFLEPLGVRGDGTTVSSVDIFRYHPVTSGLNDLTLASGGGLFTARRKHSIGGHDGLVGLAALTYGEGRVVVVADINIFDNTRITLLDNTKLLENAIAWLSWDIGTAIDDDLDGWNADLDCNDLEYTVSPQRSELCDGLDNDCDGSVDEDLPDLDGDGLCD